MPRPDPRPNAQPPHLRRAKQAWLGLAGLTIALLILAAVVRPPRSAPPSITQAVTRHGSIPSSTPAARPVIEDGTLKVSWHATPTDTPDSLATLVAGLVVEMAATTAANVHSMRIDLSILDANASWVMIGFLGANLVEARASLERKGQLQAELKLRFESEIRRMPGAVALSSASSAEARSAKR